MARQKNRDKIRELINFYDLFDDIFKLADAYILIERSLIKGGFPIREYKEWIKKQK